MDVVGVTVHFDEFAPVVRAYAGEHSKSIIETSGRKHLAAKLSSKRNVVNQPVHGILVATVNPAYTSQNCSRCGERNTPNGKTYVCEHCGHTDHRDANAAFNIAKRGAESISMGGTQDSVSLSGAVLVTPSLEVPAYA